MENIIIALIVAIPGILAALLSYLNGRQIKVVYHTINSRFDVLLRAEKAAGRAEGLKEGRAEKYQP